MTAALPLGWITERRVLALLETTGQFHYRLSADGSVIHRLWGEGINEDLTGPLDDLLGRRLPPEDQRLVQETIAAAVRERRPFDIEHRVLRPDGGAGWIRSRAVPLLGLEGQIEEWLGAAEDVTARREAQERLREREERLRLALDIAGLSTWDWNLATGSVAWSDSHFRDLGYVPGEVEPSYETWAARLHPGDLPGTEALLRAAYDLGGLYEAEFRVVPAPGKLRWFRARGGFLPGEDGPPRRMLGVMQDVTAAREAEARQRTLLAELQYRVRNSLATIRAILRRSARSATSLAHYASHLEGRIDALARVEAAAARAPGAGLDLEALLRDEFQAAAASEEQVALSGPPLRLPARTAEMLALTFHELATNAIKFGALAAPGGAIAVTWSAEGSDPPRLRLRWEERAAQPPSPPGRPGFGTELLERMLAQDLGATTRIAHRPEGLSCEIDLPLAAPGR